MAENPKRKNLTVQIYCIVKMVAKNPMRLRVNQRVQQKRDNPLILLKSYILSILRMCDVER